MKRRAATQNTCHMSESTKATEPKTPHTRKATPPFDREDADFIIRSRDNVDFYVFRAILMLASTVFEDMLPIPQPPVEGSNTGSKHKPVVAVSEENHIIDTFLRVVYPLTTPETTSLFHVREVLEAGMKYDASAVVNEMRTALTKPSILADDPLQVFSIAYNCNFEEETKTAAVHAVAQGHLAHVEAHLPTLAGVTAGAYYRLMQLHRNHCCAHPGPGLESKKDGPSPMPIFDGIGPFCREEPQPAQSTGGTIPSVLPPFTDPRADLILKSRDGRKFRVQRAILDAASPTLLRSLVAESDADSGGTPTYRMPENSAVVDALLRLCYPGRRPRFPPSPSPSSGAHFLSVLAALQRYDLSAADDLVHAHWTAYAWREPLRFFFYAVARGLAPQAHACAQLVAGSASSTALHTLYVPEMEAVGALAYHRLLRYVEACRAAALHSVGGCGWGPDPAAIDKDKLSPDLDPNPELAARPCVDGVKCVCADGARAQAANPTTKTSTNAKPKTLPAALLRMLAAKLHREPRGGALLHDHALVAALAAAAHDAMCAPEFRDYAPPSFPGLLFALAMGWWCWSFLIMAVVALAMGEIQVRCGCPKGKHIPWAEMRLRDIARRVDEAVAQVKFDLSGVLE